jgi:hypothetical protein
VLVRLPLDLPQISLRGIEYKVNSRIVDIPEDYLADLLLAQPASEPVTSALSNARPAAPFDDGRNKI